MSNLIFKVTAISGELQGRSRSGWLSSGGCGWFWSFCLAHADGVEKRAQRYIPTRRKALRSYVAELRRTVIILACSLVLGLAGFGGAMAQKRSDVLPLEVTGVAKPLQEVELFPLIDGVVARSSFKLGQAVRKGDILLELDPEPYQLKVNRAKIKLENARLKLDTIKKELDRVEDLIARRLMKRTGLYDLVLAHELTQGEIDEAQVELEQAEYELSRTIIKSPIDGYVSRINVDVGDFVSPNQGLGDPEQGQMLELVNYKPIRVVVGIEQGLELKLYQEKLEDEDLRFVLELPTGEKYPHPGELVGSYHRADPETGNVNYELLFPNPDRLLVPGLKVKVQIMEKASDGHKAQAQEP